MKRDNIGLGIRWKDVFITKIDIWDTGVQKVLRHEAIGKQGLE